MTYRQAFDRLGNPVHQRARYPLLHRVVQRLALLACLVLLALLYGGR